MKIHDLQPPEGSNRGSKRVARGIGGKGGKTAGRGSKGQRARNTVRVGFEGGQNPLHLRLPKLRGFNNPFRVEYQAVNLDTIALLQNHLSIPALDLIDSMVGCEMSSKVVNSNCTWERWLSTVSMDVALSRFNDFMEGLSRR